MQPSISTAGCQQQISTLPLQKESGNMNCEAIFPGMHQNSEILWTYCVVSPWLWRQTPQTNVSISNYCSLICYTTICPVTARKPELFLMWLEHCLAKEKTVGKIVCHLNGTALSQSWINTLQCWGWAVTKFVSSLYSFLQFKCWKQNGIQTQHILARS